MAPWFCIALKIQIERKHTAIVEPLLFLVPGCSFHLPVSEMLLHFISGLPVTYVHSGDNFVRLQPLDKSFHFKEAAVLTIRDSCKWNNTEGVSQCTLLATCEEYCWKQQRWLEINILISDLIFMLGGITLKSWDNYVDWSSLSLISSLLKMFNVLRNQVKGVFSPISNLTLYIETV